MDTSPHTNVVAAFRAVTVANPTAPLVTFYDDATGERTELSATTLSNWVAKTANLLVDSCGLAPGDRAALRLPGHWQSAAVLLGCWSAGLVIDRPGPGEDPAAVATTVAVAFVTADEVASTTADEIYALALAPMAGAFRPGPPPGSQDFVTEVRAHGDHFAPATALSPEAFAFSDGTRHSDLIAAAARRGVPTGARVLIDVDTLTDPVDWLVAPLVAGASMVLCRNLDPDIVPARLITERAIAYPG